jgi:hypothetical protein
VAHVVGCALRRRLFAPGKEKASVGDGTAVLGCKAAW